MCIAGYSIKFGFNVSHYECSVDVSDGFPKTIKIGYGVRGWDELYPVFF